MPEPTPEPTSPSGDHRTRFPVRYHETDQMGVVHHAVYVHWFEVGRTDMMSCSGLDYAAMERSGVMLAVADVGLRYVSPARFGDTVEVATRLTKVERVRVRFEYQVFVVGETPRLVCEGHTLLACCGPSLRPVRLPAEARQRMLDHLAAEGSP